MHAWKLRDVAFGLRRPNALHARTYSSLSSSGRHRRANIESVHAHQLHAKRIIALADNMRFVCMLPKCVNICGRLPASYSREMAPRGVGFVYSAHTSLFLSSSQITTTNRSSLTIAIRAVCRLVYTDAHRLLSCDVDGSVLTQLLTLTTRHTRSSSTRRPCGARNARWPRVSIAKHPDTS